MAAIAASNAKVSECCAEKSGIAQRAERSSTHGKARLSRDMGTTVPNLVGQSKMKRGSNSFASFAEKKLTGHNGKSKTGGLATVLRGVLALHVAAFCMTAEARCSSLGSAGNGYPTIAPNAEQLNGWNSITLYRASREEGQIVATRKPCASRAISASITTAICHTTHGSKCTLSTQDVFKPSLIDLEARQRATGRKQAQAVQRERLSERARYSNSVMRQSEPSYNFRRSEGGRSEEVAPPSEMMVSRREPKVTECMYYSGGEVLNIGSSDVMSAAEFDWKQAACAVVATGLEVDVQNTGKEAIIDLLESRIKNAERTMKNNICNGMYSDGTGTGGKQIGGLQLLVADAPTTGTVGGINRANYSFWRNQVWDATSDGGAATSSTTIQANMNATYLRCSRGGDKPDLILADSVYYKHFWASLQAIQRITDSKMADAGFQSIKFAGADVVYEDNTGMPASHMYFLNTDYIFLRYAAKRLFKPLEKVQSINQDAMVQLITFAGNMTTSNASLQGVYKE